MIKSRGWYEFNWNPIIGCLNACPYCYAKKYAVTHGMISDFTNPAFFKDKLREPKMIMWNATIFVCAYADLFGDWVPREWIEEVLKVVKETPQHTYVFLTKNPKRYAEFQFPDNSYIGVTIEGTDKMWRAEAIKDLPFKKFCSIEPIMGDFTGVDLSMFDWVVAGYMLYKKKTFKEKQWMKSIVHHNLYKIVR